MSQFTKAVAAIQQRANGQGAGDMALVDAAGYVTTVLGWHGITQELTDAIGLATEHEITVLRQRMPTNGGYINEMLRRVHA